MSEGERLRQIANAFFKENKLNLALENYSQAIAVTTNDEDLATLYANRSITYLKLESYGAAVNDANESVKLNESFIKGYYRRACAYMALGKFKLALNDFDNVLEVCKGDKYAMAKRHECEKTLTRNNMLKALNSIDLNSEINMKNIDKIYVEETYNGPVLMDKRVTDNFARDLVQYLKAQKLLHRKFALQLIGLANEMQRSKPTLRHIDVSNYSKLTICGDIHGQYYDLLNIFETNGFPSNENAYLFNGDFVDRGSFSVECILLLITYTLLYPNSFFLNRGNHEAVTMNQMYGFEGEVKYKYGSELMTSFTQLFNSLPLAYLINKRVFVVHGGLSAAEITLEDVNGIKRFCQPPDTSCLMTDLLWSDPQPGEGVGESKRGVGIQFGPDITKRFLEQNQLDYIIRSHEVKETGYEVAHDGKCITIFSAPNYCDSVGNLGAYITITPSNLSPKFTTFSAVTHPDVPAMKYASQFMR